MELGELGLKGLVLTLLRFDGRDLRLDEALVLEFLVLGEACLLQGLEVLGGLAVCGKRLAVGLEVSAERVDVAVEELELGLRLEQEHLLVLAVDMHEGKGI